MRRLIDALHPLLVPSILGLPGLAVPTGLVQGVPMGVQLVAARFQEAIACVQAKSLRHGRRWRRRLIHVQVEHEDRNVAVFRRDAG
jgi:Asp-tRNA(Asn)/Glu-tRNA(Gln) amidotransferase A subunit family amidase